MIIKANKVRKKTIYLNIYGVNSLVLAIAILKMSDVKTVMAQNNLGFDLINGLFTPTQSQDFFQLGREQFEKELEIFIDLENYLNDNLLQIDPALTEQIKLPQQSYRFESSNSQYELLHD